MRDPTHRQLPYGRRPVRGDPGKRDGRGTVVVELAGPGRPEFHIPWVGEAGGLRTRRIASKSTADQMGWEFAGWSSIRLGRR